MKVPESTSTLTRSVSEPSISLSEKQNHGHYRSFSVSKAEQSSYIPSALTTEALRLRNKPPAETPKQINKIPQAIENQSLKDAEALENSCVDVSDNQRQLPPYNNPLLPDTARFNHRRSCSESTLNNPATENSQEISSLEKTRSLTLIPCESTSLPKSDRHRDLSKVALLPESDGDPGLYSRYSSSFSRTGSNDTLDQLVEGLTAGHELDKRQLMTNDILMIVFKRWFRHAAVSTAAADVAAYSGSPGTGGVFIITMSLAGIVDALYKCGEKCSNKNTIGKLNAFFLRACELLFSGLHGIRSHIPERLALIFKKTYYQCSLMAAGCTVPADLLSHAHDAGYLKNKITPAIICPLTIILPTALMAFSAIKNFLIKSRPQENELLGILDTLEMVFKRMAVHAAAGTVSADIAVYLGQPTVGVLILLAMGLAGLIDGLTQCGERLEKEPGNHRLNGTVQALCRHLYKISWWLETKLPACLQNLFYKAYLYSSVTGAAGTIIADILAHLNTSNPGLSAKICPITIGLLTTLGSLSPIVSEALKNTVKPATEPVHFLMRDDPPNII